MDDRRSTLDDQRRRFGRRFSFDGASAARAPYRAAAINVANAHRPGLLSHPHEPL
jgi:hypothetical protein